MSVDMQLSHYIIVSGQINFLLAVVNYDMVWKVRNQISNGKYLILIHPQLLLEARILLPSASNNESDSRNWLFLGQFNYKLILILKITCTDRTNNEEVLHPVKRFQDR